MHCVLSLRARWSIVCAAVVLLGALSGAAFAATTGKIAGRVTDAESGGPIPGAAVMVEGFRLGATTDSDGRYFVFGVPPGTHSIRATLVGYTPVTQAAVRVNIDRTTPVDFALSPTAIEGGGRDGRGGERGDPARCGREPHDAGLA